MRGRVGALASYCLLTAPIRNYKVHRFSHFLVCPNYVTVHKCVRVCVCVR